MPYSCTTRIWEELTEWTRILRATGLPFEGKWILFTWMIDAAVNNAWYLYRKSGKKISKLEFIREIATYYATTFKEPLKIRGPLAQSRAVKVRHCTRYDNVGHLVAPIEKRRRCNYEDCSSTVKTVYV